MAVQRKLWPYFTASSFRDADETISWISEKDAVLSSDDFGKDLASVQTLQRKHEGIERDLAALEVSNRLQYIVVGLALINLLRHLKKVHT